MSGDTRVDELLARWDEAQARGESTAVEDLCGGRADLVDALKRAIASREATGPPESAGTPTVSLGDTVGVDSDAYRPGATSTDLAPALGGRLGDFRIVKALGAGGMGEVYHAVDERLGRPIALKTLRPELARDPRARERFLREARAAAALSHDHVVAVYQVGEEQGVPYLVMPLLSGEALDARLERDARLGAGEALRITREAAEGLAAAHDRGMVHRDVKPGNIWLESPRGRVKLLDFGLARTADEADARLTQTGSVLGTPAYMPPEQARGERVDHRGDLYSLGAVAYRMTTGRAPFQARTVPAILAAVLRDDPPSVRDLAPELPPPFADLIERLLGKDPESRPQSAREVIEAIVDLERRLAGLNTPERPPGPLPEPGAGSARGSRKRTGVLAGLLLGVAALAAMAVRRGGDAPTGVEESAVAGSPAGVRRPVDAKETPAPADAPVAWTPGPLAGALPGLLPRQARLPGMGRWQLETVGLRGMGQGLSWSARGGIALAESCGTIRVFDGATYGLRRLILNPANVQAVAWDPTGTRLAVAGDDSTVRVWNADGSRLDLRGHQGGWCLAVAWSPDGRRLGSTGQDGTVRVWQADGSAGPVLTAGRDMTAVAWSPDGRWLAAVGVEGVVKVWDADGAAERSLDGHRGPVYAVAWHPTDGRLATAGDDGEIRIWAADGKASTSLEGHDRRVRSLAWSADGTRLASGGEDATARIWNPDGEPRKVVSMGVTVDNVRDVSWSPDGRRLAASGVGHFLRVWEVDGTPVAEIRGPDSYRGTIAWDADGSRLGATRRYYPSAPALATIGADGRPGPSFRTTEGGGLFHFAWSPDGAGLAAFGDWSGGAWHVALLTPDGRPVLNLHGSEGPLNAMAWSPDASRLAVAYGFGGTREVRLWRSDGTPGPVLKVPSDPRALAWSPDNSRFAAGCEDGRIYTWTSDGTPGATLDADAGAVSSLAWRPGGEVLASATADGAIRFWERGERPGRVFREGVQVFCLAWEPGGARLASGDAGGNVELWSAAGEPLGSWKDHDRVVTSVAWSPRGDRLASLDYASRVIVWDARDGRPLWTAVPLTDSRYAVFSTAGELLHGDGEAIDRELVVAVEDAPGRLELLPYSKLHRRAAEAAAAQRVGE